MRPLLVIALIATACYGNGGSEIANATFAPFLNVDLTQSTLLANGEYVRDLVPGTGAAVLQGQTLSVNYTAWLADGTVAGTNDGTGQTFDFVLGTSAVAGINQGLGGMNVGGTRQLILPPALAFGDQGSTGSVPGGAIVVYQIQVVSAH
jgi:FKBP-type peptidyl-prolyl cis-trans isomerase